MNDIDASLMALRDVVLTAAPLGNIVPLTAAYAYPKQLIEIPMPIETDTLPVAMVHRRTNRRNPVGAKAAGLARHFWVAYVDLLLAPGPLMNHEQILEADTLFYPWWLAVQSVLFTNLTLNGTADMIGGGAQGSDVFDYIDTHLQWFQKDFWGIRFEVPVRHSWAQDMSG
jgi:hypothetical protein